MYVWSLAHNKHLSQEVEKTATTIIILNLIYNDSFIYGINGWQMDWVYDRERTISFQHNDLFYLGPSRRGGLFSFVQVLFLVLGFLSLAE